MKKSLHHSHAIEVRASSLHGYGVFATREIENGEIIEECYYLALQKSWLKTDETLKDYVFMWSKKYPLASAAVLGYGMIYNHSKEFNVGYKRNTKDKVFTFFTTKDVAKDEELFINYGEGYAAQRIKRGLA